MERSAPDPSDPNTLPRAARRAAGVLTLAGLLLAGCAPADEATGPTLAEGVTPEGLADRVEQFAPVTVTFDTTLLDESQKSVVAELVRASDELDAVFERQVWRQNRTYGEQLREASGPGLEAARAYYEIMYGPWDRLEENEPFLAAGPKPPGAGYYPEDLTREEFEGWLEEHPDDREAFTSYYTAIRRTAAGGLEAVPYSEFYSGRLEDAAAHLREAAKAAENESLRHFLELRADAFLSNEYFDSEVAWMRLEGNRVDPTIGPYEVYEDDLFGYKAAFESFVTIRDPEASQRLDRLKSELRGLEEALPVPDRHKNTERSFESPISVVDVAYTAGDTRAGVQTLAFNLPNDPRVREEEGSKKVMLRNIIDAKFRKILRPIARTVLDSAQAARITARPYFTRILMHELAHGLGPDYLTDRPEVTVSDALQERYSAIEEAKADAVGSHSLRVLTREGLYDRSFLEQVYIDHLADLFRCVRFGVGEAHGMGCLTQFNYLREQGAIQHDPETGKFSVDFGTMPTAMADLAAEYLTLEATGDYEGAGAFVEEYGTMSGEMKDALVRLESVPVDIRPSYAVKDMIDAW